MNFNYYLPVNLIFGRGKAELIGTEAAKYGKKHLSLPAIPVRRNQVFSTVQ